MKCTQKKSFTWLLALIPLLIGGVCYNATPGGAAFIGIIITFIYLLNVGENLDRKRKIDRLADELEEAYTRIRKFTNEP